MKILAFLAVILCFVMSVKSTFAEQNNQSAKKQKKMIVLPPLKEVSIFILTKRIVGLAVASAIASASMKSFLFVFT